MGSLKRVRFEEPKPDYFTISEEALSKMRPQEGPQEMFAESKADIAILGGAAGGGKSYSLLLEPLRNIRLTGKFSGVIFRRTTPSITHPGSLWDTARDIYSEWPRAKAFESAPLHWIFPDPDNIDADGAKVQFSHLEHEKTVKDWHGSQIPFIGFDELTEFTQYQFWYMLSRNRSTCGVKPYMRATCNADSDSWVSELISWWIDQGTGFPILERAGKLRWFIRVGDELKWADDPEDLQPERLGLPRFTEDGKENQYLVKSLTFIPATVYQNKALMNTNPEYLGSLLSLPKVERERLLGGNWKIKPAAGLHFRREWIEVIEADQVPSNLQYKRGWDLAATEKTQVNDPDFTTSTLIGKDSTHKDPYTYVVDHTFAQISSQKVERLIVNKASQDGMGCEQWLPQDPGAAGKAQAVHHRRLLDGYTCYTTPETGDKLTRFGPFSSQAEAGWVKVVRAPWNDRWFQQLEGFPDSAHDDDVDSTSRAFNAFEQAKTGMVDWARQQVAKMRQAEAERNAPAVIATKANGGVCFQGPPNVTVLFGLKGEAIFQNEDGHFVVTEKHAQALRRPTSGFKEVKG